MAAFMNGLGLPHSRPLLSPLSPAGLLLRMSSNLVQIYARIPEPCNDMTGSHPAM